jgi:hypothetical protein
MKHIVVVAKIIGRAVWPFPLFANYWPKVFLFDFA